MSALENWVLTTGRVTITPWSSQAAALAAVPTLRRGVADRSPWGAVGVSDALGVDDQKRVSHWVTLSWCEHPCT